MRINKGCWLNLVLGVVGLPIAYLLDSIFIGWLWGISLGYYIGVQVSGYFRRSSKHKRKENKK